MLAQCTRRRGRPDDGPARRRGRGRHRSGGEAARRGDGRGLTGPRRHRRSLLRGALRGHHAFRLSHARPRVRHRRCAARDDARPYLFCRYHRKRCRRQPAARHRDRPRPRALPRHQPAAPAPRNPGRARGYGSGARPEANRDHARRRHDGNSGRRLVLRVSRRAVRGDSGESYRSQPTRIGRLAWLLDG